jgi:hypothetical protein
MVLPTGAAPNALLINMPTQLLRRVLKLRHRNYQTEDTAIVCGMFQEDNDYPSSQSSVQLHLKQRFSGIIFSGSNPRRIFMNFNH